MYETTTNRGHGDRKFGRAPSFDQYYIDSAPTWKWYASMLPSRCNHAEVNYIISVSMPMRAPEEKSHNGTTFQE